MPSQTPAQNRVISLWSCFFKSKHEPMIKLSRQSKACTENSRQCPSLAADTQKNLFCKHSNRGELLKPREHNLGGAKDTMKTNRIQEIWWKPCIDGDRAIKGCSRCRIYYAKLLTEKMVLPRTLALSDTIWHRLKLVLIQVCIIAICRFSTPIIHIQWGWFRPLVGEGFLKKVRIDLWWGVYHTHLFWSPTP